MDDELVRQAAHGDAEAFDALARDRIDRLFGIAVRILRDHHDAEDAVQQALWTAWCDLPGLRETARFDAWLYRLLVRSCYRAGRTRRRRSSVVRIAPSMEELAGAADADTISDRDTLERAFGSLTTEQRAVVVLHHYSGLGLDEVASVLGIPSGTARSRLHYALRKLRSAIEAPGEASRQVAETGR